MFRYLAFSLWVIACCSCGGGGGGNNDSKSSAGQSSSGDSLNSAGDSFPELAVAPANNQVMSSCLSVAVPAGNITGTIYYERVPLFNDGLDYDDIRTLPARGVVVQAVDAPSGSCSTAVVATALTNGNGEYGLDVPADQTVCIEVRAQLYRDGRNGGPAWNVQVVDNTNEQAPYYLVDGTPAAPAAEPVRNLLAGSGAVAGFPGYTGPRAAAPFAILDSICEAVDTVIETDGSLQLPLLKINWSENNTAADGEVEDGDIGGTFYQEIRYLDSQGTITAYDRNIFLLGQEDSNTDEYDPHVINHEFTHYLTAVLSRFDAPGGEHILGDRLDPRLALEEGFADAFAAISLDGATSLIADSRTYKDSLGKDQSLVFGFSVDRNFTGSYGWYSESTVYSTVYNAYDSENGWRDDLTLGVGPLLDVLRSDAYVNSDALISLFTFYHVLKQQSTQDYAIDLLLGSESIEPITDPFGSGESSTNNDVDGRPDVEPVYLQLEQGVSQEACSNNQFGEGNKLSNGRFMRFDPVANGGYRFRAEPVTTGRPVIEVYTQGRLIESATSPARGTAVSVDAQVSGEVVAIVFDYDNINDDGAAPGRYCFDVLVN